MVKYSKIPVEHAGSVVRLTEFVQVDAEVRWRMKCIICISWIKRPLGRPRHRWEDNIRIDLQEVGGGRGDWMELAQDRDRWRALVGTVRNFRIP
jgi:hypothetical protein